MDEIQPKSKKPNHLINETSPYLLQHAYNLVDWFPWGDIALNKAKEEKKLVFLSIGYSTCHWCHVMAHESFEDKETANILNKNFISIKLDREERPDLDQIYQTVIQLSGKNGGWPLSVFLTPDGKPFFAGNYFPNISKYGLMSFKELLHRLLDLYSNKKEEIEKSALSITDALNDFSKYIETTGSKKDNKSEENFEITQNLIDHGIKNLINSFDTVNGGFGTAPKFPAWTTLLFGIRQYAEMIKNQKYDKQISVNLRENLQLTLNMMSNGGIYDQIGGGFARYSVDNNWIIPHFEKMLYDNAMALIIYSEAYQVFRISRYHEIVEEIIQWLLRRMYVKGKGFYSAMDADSEGEEGKFYVWKKSELEKIVPEQDRDLFFKAYGITSSGNFEKNTNNLNRVFSDEELAEEFKIDANHVKGKLKDIRNIILKERLKRIPPKTDTKINISWNSLLIHGLYAAYEILGDKKYNNEYNIKQISHDILNFFLNTLYDKEKGLIYSIYDEKTDTFKNYGNLETYAHLTQALFDDFSYYPSQETFGIIIKLINTVEMQFVDKNGGGYFYSSNLNEDTLARLKNFTDSPLPSGNGITAENLLQLNYFTGIEEYLNRAEQILNSSIVPAINNPTAYGSFLTASQWYLYGSDDIAIIDFDEKIDEDNPNDKNNKMNQSREFIKRYFIPRKHLFFSEDSMKNIPSFNGKTIKNEKTTYYLCHNFNCVPPTNNKNEFISNLDKFYIKIA